ncbi:MAG: plastocyanin/azurin family copper-binding protein [Nitriliruptorales bacterium]|nr:plastocyanin/azurin family copper-binding protein [Nitriliruptorales bacterium]
MSARRVRALAAGCALASLTVLAAIALPAWAATHQVQLGDNFFRPETITIEPGDTVEWSYRGTVQHNVVAADGSWRSGDFNQTGLITDTYSRTFTDPGTHRYVCTYHGACENNREGPCFGDMWGTIIVTGGDPDPEPSEPTAKPTQPGPKPTQPGPDPTQPDATPTDADPTAEPSASPATPAPSASPGDGQPDATPEPPATPTPDTISVGDLGDGEDSDSRGPLLLLATFLVAVTGAGQFVFGRA